MRDPIAFWPKIKSKKINIVCLLAGARWRWSQRFGQVPRLFRLATLAAHTRPFACHGICSWITLFVPQVSLSCRHTDTHTHSRAEHLCHHSRRRHRHCHQHRYRATTVSAARKALRRRTNPTWKLVSVQRTCTRFNAPHSTTLDRSNSSRLGMGDWAINFTFNNTYYLIMQSLSILHLGNFAAVNYER